MRLCVCAALLLSACASPTAVPDGSSDGSSETSTPLDTGVSAPDASASLPDAAAMMDAIASDASGRDASGASSIESLVSRAMFEQIFLHRGTAPCRGGFYTYDAFVQAAREFPRFASEGTDEQRKREVAAFLANISHETTGGWDTAPDGRYSWGLCWIEEGGASPQTAEYCAPSMEYPCAAGQRYYGRGPIQLSWNYNYGQAGAALGLDLLGKPELVTSDPKTTFLTALWFWMTPQAPKPSAHAVMAGTWTPTSDDLAKGRKAGFGMTVVIINGGLECGFPTDARVKDRIGFYERYVTMLGTTKGDAVECATMKPY